MKRGEHLHNQTAPCFEPQWSTPAAGHINAHRSAPRWEAGKPQALPMRCLLQSVGRC